MTKKLPWLTLMPVLTKNQSGRESVTSGAVSLPSSPQAAETENEHTQRSEVGGGGVHFVLELRLGSTGSQS